MFVAHISHRGGCYWGGHFLDDNILPIQTRPNLLLHLQRWRWCVKRLPEPNLAGRQQRRVWLSLFGARGHLLELHHFSFFFFSSLRNVLCCLSVKFTQFLFRSQQVKGRFGMTLSWLIFALVSLWCENAHWLISPLQRWPQVTVRLIHEGSVVAEGVSYAGRLVTLIGIAWCHAWVFVDFSRLCEVDNWPLSKKCIHLSLGLSRKLWNSLHSRCFYLLKMRPCSIVLIRRLSYLLGPVLHIFTCDVVVIDLLDHLPSNCSGLLLLCFWFRVLSVFLCNYSQLWIVLLENLKVTITFFAVLL